MSTSSRFLLYLYSTRNIVGCCLALIGVGAYLGGLIDSWWLPICVGLYFAGALIVPTHELIDISLYQRYDGARLVEGVEQLISQSRKRLPAEAMAVLDSIPVVLRPLVPRLTGSDDSPMLPPAHVQTVIGAITRDLPETIAGYARLPVAFATTHAVQGGKTPKALLVDQLTLLRDQLEKISVAAFADDAEALVVNGRYLQEKFHAPAYLE